MVNTPSAHVNGVQALNYHDLIQLQFHYGPLETQPPSAFQNAINKVFEAIGGVFEKIQKGFAHINGAYQKLSPVAKRPFEISQSLTGGAMMGYVAYWITRLIARLGFLGELKEAINPRSFILMGVANNAVIETARLIYDIAQAIFGERSVYEDGTRLEAKTAVGQLRHHTWKVVGLVEEVPQEVDAIFSCIFDIRTAKTIRESNIQDRELYFIEIFRRAMGEQIFDSLKEIIPQELGMRIVEACGYSILGAHLFVWFYGLGFINGLIDKITRVYNKVYDEELEAQDERERENKMYLDILAELYPSEIAELDAIKTFEIKDDDIEVKEWDQNVTIRTTEVKGSFDAVKDIETKIQKHQNLEPFKHINDLKYRHVFIQSDKIKDFPVRNDEESLISEDEPLDVQHDLAKSVKFAMN